jgi:hypothetical protein
MILHRISTCLLYILCYFSTFSNSYVLFYHTENSSSVQYYDCIYYTRSMIQDNIQNVKYCRQLNRSQLLPHDFNQSCQNGGRLWPFEELSRLNVSTSEVLQWSSSMEQTDRYAKYLSNSSLDVEDRYICNCTNLASFGKFCEYKFYNGSTSFADAVKKQFQPLEYSNMNNDSVTIGSQLHNNRPCYTTWTCNSGLMCLDWRHICDGKYAGLIILLNSSFRLYFQVNNSVWMVWMKIIARHWNSMNVKMMNIDVQMECVFQKNIGWMVIMIVWIGQMRRTLLFIQDSIAFVYHRSLVMNICVHIVNGRAGMVSFHSYLM